MTLRAKIVALVLGLTAAILGGLWLTLSRSWMAWSSEAVAGELRDRSEAIAAVLELEDGQVELEEKHLGRSLRDPSHPFRVVGAKGETLFARGELPWPSASIGLAAPRTDTLEEDERHWVVLTSVIAVHEKRGGEPLHLALQVAGEVAAHRALEARFRSGLLVALLAALLVGGAGAAVLAHVSLAPLRRLAAEMDAIGATSLDRRVGTAGLDAELGRVAGAFNALLGRLEDAMQRQRAFVSRASHALRTPVATVLTRAEVALRRNREPAAYRQALDDVAAGAREASALVSHLLMLSRLDERRGALAPEDVPLEEAVEQLVRVHAQRAAEAGVTLSAEVPEGLAVRADRAALRELIEALLDNAIHYTPAGGRAGVRATADAGRCTLTVWDSGPGIPAAERERVFDRFYRGQDAVAAGKSGSGLGLAIVKAIADAHGAPIALADRPGGGLEVRIAFPASASASLPGSAPAAAATAERTSLG